MSPSYSRPPLTPDPDQVARRKAAWDRVERDAAAVAAKRKRTLLEDDVAAMISERTPLVLGAAELAHDIITVVRERVLREIGTYARENVR